MKLLKIDEGILKNLQVGESNIIVVPYETALNVGDEVEFFGSNDNAQGVASINEISIRRYSDVKANQELKAQLSNYDIKEGDPVKLLIFEFNRAPASNNIANKVTMKGPDSVKTYSDGGSRGNPGPSASGYVVLDMSDNVLHEEGVYLGFGTNNNAEYLSLKFALEKAKQIGAHKVYAFMDSQLVINQMKGVYKIKHPGLFEIYKDVKKLEKEFTKVTYQHVPRALNKLADAEVNKSLDKQADI